MKYLIYYLIVFIIVYLFYLITVVLNKKKHEKYKKSNQVLYFIKRYNMDVKKIDMKKFTNVLALSNAFIIATAFLATFLVSNIYLQLLLALIVLIPVMLLTYHIMGIFIKKGRLQ